MESEQEMYKNGLRHILLHWNKENYHVQTVSKEQEQTRRCKPAFKNGRSWGIDKNNNYCVDSYKPNILKFMHHNGS